MALPALSSPEFMTEIPSTKQKIKFRPFLVKEEKILYMALEGQDPIEITNAIQNTLESCILTEGIDVAKLATFDIEHLFLQLRGKSVGEEVEIVLRHKEGDCKESVNLSINLDEIKVKGDITDGKIMINDKIGVKMRYPSFSDTSKITDVDSAEGVFGALAVLIEYIYDKETVYNDFDRSEMVNWLGNLNQEQFKKLTDYIQNVPKLSHEVEWTCNVCKKKETILLEGLQSFFT